MTASKLRIAEPVPLEALRDEWPSLALRSSRIFSTYDWLETWWESFGRGRPLLTLPVHDDGDDRLVAILPLYVGAQGLLRLARFVGHGAADELGAVCAPGDIGAVVTALGALLDAGGLRVDLFLGDALPEAEAWQQALGGRTIHRTSSPIAVFEGTDWEEYLRSLSRNLREQIRSRERRLFRDQRVNYRLATDPATLDADMDTFFALHNARWATSSSLRGRENFYRRFAARALANGWLRLSFLEVDGRAVATHLDFRYAGIHYQYNSGRDPAWNASSVGFVLRVLTMRDALEDGISEYRFLRGPEPYKWRFANEDRPSAVVAVPCTVMGKLAVGAAGVMARSRLGKNILIRGASRA